MLSQHTHTHTIIKAMHRLLKTFLIELNLIFMALLLEHKSQTGK